MTLINSTYIKGVNFGSCTCMHLEKGIKFTNSLSGGHPADGVANRRPSSWTVVFLQ